MVAYVIFCITNVHGEKGLSAYQDPRYHCVPAGSHPRMPPGVPVGSRCRHKDFLGAMSASDTAC